MISPHLLETGYEIFSVNKAASKTKNKRNDLRFVMTMGYEKFRLDLPLVYIIFCPYCGVNLFDFYTNDKYVNELEGHTFTSP